jgi:hypothetical protein
LLLADFQKRIYIHGLPIRANNRLHLKHRILAFDDTT